SAWLVDSTQVRSCSAAARSQATLSLTQPESALSTAPTSSLTATLPSLSRSNAGHALTFSRPRSMLTPVSSSSIVTSPWPPQSPTQASGCAPTVIVPLEPVPTTGSPVTKSTP